jgi:predicted nucleic acid-binding protein
MVTNPKASPDCEICRSWLESLLIKNVVVKIPEIADYEVLRELLRANKLKGLKRLDELKNRLPYIPINTQTMLKAAKFWATARQSGQPTAGSEALDGDVILAAQAALLQSGGDTVVVATTNFKHLSRFVDAREWKTIQ